MNDDLATTWRVTKKFCTLINLAAEKKQRLSRDILLDTMISIMYSLLQKKPQRNSVDAAIHFGLLAFSSNIFLQWQDIGMSHSRFPPNYTKNILFLDGVSSQMLLWLLMIGALSIFPEPHETRLKHGLQMNIKLYGVKSWIEMREILKSFLWIDLLHDKPGKDIFDFLVLS